MHLESGRAGFAAQAVSPFREMGTYEALWSRPGTTFASLAARFAERPGSVPSDYVAAADPSSILSRVEGSGGGQRGVRQGAFRGSRGGALRPFGTRPSAPLRIRRCSGAGGPGPGPPPVRAGQLLP